MSPRDMVFDIFRSLRIRNYRLFTTAQLFSMSGTWMQTVAQAWLVLKLSDSGVALGLTTGLQFLPTAVLGLWGGVLADRFDKRRILIVTQALAGALAAILGVLTLTGVVELWMVYLLALALGVVTAADTPARQAFVTEMVGPKDVANAVGLNSAAFNTARIVGPALAAAVIASLGLGMAFVLNAVTYLAPIVALTAMDKRALYAGERAVRQRGLLTEGLRYAARTPEIRRTLALLAVVSTLGFNFTVTIPMLARFTFNAGVNTYAILSSVLAGGGLIGALWVARRARPTPKLLAGAAAAFGIAALCAAAAPTLPTAAVLLTITGGTAMAFIATANSTLQLRAPTPLRGRVMALYALVFLGSTPLGGPLVGWIAEQWGARAGIAVGGAAALIAAAVSFAVIARQTRRTERDAGVDADTAARADARAETHGAGEPEPTPQPV